MFSSSLRTLNRKRFRRIRPFDPMRLQAGEVRLEKSNFASHVANQEKALPCTTSLVASHSLHDGYLLNRRITRLSQGFLEGQRRRYREER